jgi:hypothetical protein
MKTLLIVYLAFISYFQFVPFAIADICTEVERSSDSKLNEAECYVLERVEKGEVAHFKKGENLRSWQLSEAEFQDRFSKIEDRTLRADFLRKLLTGSLSDLNIS